MKDFKAAAAQRRKERNAEISKAIKDGSQIDAGFDKMESFFPARPIIKKDQAAINRLYGADNKCKA